MLGISFTGEFQLVTLQSDEFSQVSEKFARRWVAGAPPSIRFIFAIANSELKEKWRRYRNTLNQKSIEEYFHGTTLACDLMTSRTLCNNGHCGICGIACSGPDPRYIKRTRFGKGFYLAHNSSRSDGYTEGVHGYRAVLLCNILPGEKYELQHNDVNLTGPPPGYDSICGKVGSEPEIVLFKPQAIMPRYVIIYKKD